MLSGSDEFSPSCCQPQLKLGRLAVKSWGSKQLLGYPLYMGRVGGLHIWKWWNGAGRLFPVSILVDPDLLGSSSSLLLTGENSLSPPCPTCYAQLVTVNQVSPGKQIVGQNEGKWRWSSPLNKNQQHNPPGSSPAQISLKRLAQKTFPVDCSSKHKHERNKRDWHFH